MKQMLVLLAFCCPNLALACLGAAPNEVIELSNISITDEVFEWEDGRPARDVGFEFTNISTCLLDSFSVRVRVFDPSGFLIDDRTYIQLRPGIFTEGFPTGYSLFGSIGVRGDTREQVLSIAHIELEPVDIVYFSQ